MATVETPPKMAMQLAPLKRRRGTGAPAHAVPCPSSIQTEAAAHLFPIRAHTCRPLFFHGERYKNETEREAFSAHVFPWQK
jgi:hypothetical protein